MSDRYLRTLLRQAQQGLVPLQDYVAAALRVSSPEAVIADLQGFSVDDIRLAVRLVWIPAYAARDKHTKARAALAGELGDPIAKRGVSSRKRNDFPDRDFFERNQALLSDKDWRLFAADCAEHVLHHWESKYPQDNRPRNAIETARRFALGEATEEELDDAESAAEAATASAEDYATWSATWYAAWSTAGSAARSAAWSVAWSAAESAARSAADATAGSAAWSVAWSATWSAARSAARSAERTWQAARLADYLVGLSSLPPPPT